MAKHAQVGWDDLIFVLAVADGGSVSAAARALGVNHATVLRRIAAFQQRSGLRLFDKTPRGYRISPDRRGVIEAMREAADALDVVERMVAAERPRLAGGLRITTTDTLAQFILPRIVADYGAQSGTRIEMIAGNAHLDLSRMEAHLAIRPALSLPPELDGMQAGQLRFAVYRSEAERSDALLGLSGPLARSPAAAWAQNHGGTADISGDSFLSLAALAATGAGRAVLPDYVGDAWPGLRLVDKPDDLSPIPLWVAAHVDLVNSGRIRRARTFIRDALLSVPALSTPGG